MPGESTVNLVPMYGCGCVRETHKRLVTFSFILCFLPFDFLNFNPKEYCCLLVDSLLAVQFRTLRQNEQYVQTPIFRSADHLVTEHAICYC